MSFQPVVTLTTVPRDNSGFTFTDATPTDGVSGYGSSTAPANAAAVALVWAMVQAYGETPSNVANSASSPSSPMPFLFSVLDGVNTFTAIYMFFRTMAYTISADGLSITVPSGAIALLTNAKYVSNGLTSFPILITNVTDTVVTLATPLAPGTSGAGLYFGYTALVQALTVNNGEGLCINGISLLPVEVDSCDNAMAIFHNLMLKVGAEIAFNCGNLSKAHEEARLLSGNNINIVPNCASCG